MSLEKNWDVLYTKNNRPTWEQINEYVDNALWLEFNEKIQGIYQVEPIMDYSSCSMQRGWNIKYKKSGKALCTLYPMSGYFIVLVVIGEKEMSEAEILIPMCSAYTQDIFNNTKLGCGQKWLMLEVRDDNILNDIYSLICLRKRPKIK